MKLALSTLLGSFPTAKPPDLLLLDYLVVVGFEESDPNAICIGADLKYVQTLEPCLGPGSLEPAANRGKADTRTQF